MALEVVGGAFLSAALSVLYDRMDSRPVLDFIRGIKNTARLFDKLKIKLLSVNKLLDDAEEKQLRDSRVREWLSELKDVLFHADDLLDEINTEALRSKMEKEDSGSSNANQVLIKFSSVSIHELDKSLESRILDILERMELIIREKDVLDLKEDVEDRIQGRLPTSFLVEESGVYGRDVEKEAIIKLLLADGVTGNKIDVLPIVGMGGIGKTTLAQIVYNDDRVGLHFEHQSWFCVSEEFDVTKITRSIYRSVTSEVCNIKDLNMLQVKLKTALTGKKFLIVFDDVWDVNDKEWDLLSRSFESGCHGSKIIVTTRIESVACRIGTLQNLQLMQLSDENCWALFSKHAFKNARVAADPLLEGIGRRIAEKCNGLPLAAKSLGRLLRSEPNIARWEEILNSDICKLQDEESQIMPALWLSYHHLPAHLKRCFAYCSIFPQGYEFYKPDLVLLWMAEGLLPLKSSKTTFEQVGENYFDDLVSSSFFKHSQHGGFTMHDLIHDLASFVSGEFCVRWEGNDSVLDNVSKSRHFGISRSFDQWNSLYVAKYLRTFLVSLPYLRKCVNLDFDIFLKLKCLRVLNLSWYAIDELPSSISKLKHLRHLDLSETGIKSLPDELCTLYNLQTLLLENCQSLVDLPSDLERLVNLRHLDIRQTKIEKMPSRVGKMKDLQTVRGEFVLYKYTGDNIVEIKELQQLRETLCISGLRNIGHVSETIRRKKKHPDELVLEWEGESGDTADTKRERDVLENLEPHTNLKNLEIRSYGGIRFPGWLEDLSCLSNLVRLKLLGCGNCLFLPPVEQLPSLQELEIEGFNGVVTVGSMPFPNLRELTLRSCPEVTGMFMLANFPKLERLELKDVNVESLEISSFPYFVGFPAPSLTSISIEGFNRVVTVGSMPFPNLRELTLRSCPEVTGMFMLANFPKLERLELKDVNVESLEISSCSNFVGFPAPSLTSLSIEQCSKLRLENEDLSCLSNLVCLTLRGCKNGLFFPPVDQLPSLQELEIEGFNGLLTVGSKPFPNLRKLCLRSCPDVTGTFILANFPKLESLVLHHVNVEYLQSPRHLSLGCLQISSCPNFVQFSDGGLSAPNLTSIEIRNCSKLRLLPQHMHKLLPSLTCLYLSECPELESFSEGELPSKLKDIRIESCQSLESIFALEELGHHEKEAAKEMNFVTLEVLSLKNLPSITGIFKRQEVTSPRLPAGNPLFSDPKLNTAECFCFNRKKANTFAAKFSGLWKTHDTGNLRTQVKQYSVLFEKSLFPKLEDLTICPKDIWYGRPAHGKKALFPATSIDRSLPHLKKLRLHGMEKFMRLWENTEPASGSAFPHMDTLEVKFLGLTNLELSAISFQNLTTLEVTFCWRLQYLTTYLVAKSLGQLNTLKVDECKNLKEIITSEGMEEDKREYYIVLNRLQHLELSDLISLERFCSSNCSVKVPMLGPVKMDWCPFKLKVSPDKFLEVDLDVQEIHFTKEVSHTIESASGLETNHGPRLPGITGSEHEVEAEIREAPIDSQNIGHGEVMDLKKKQIVTDTWKIANEGEQLELKGLDDVQLEQDIRRLRKELRAKEEEMRDRQQRQSASVDQLSDPSRSKVSRRLSK